MLAGDLNDASARANRWQTVGARVSALGARRSKVLQVMTNREMVKDPRGGPKLPEPNVPQRVLVPAPEGDPNLFTTDDPIDSPQPNPVINPRPKTRVLGGHRAMRLDQ